ncbi:MAG: hypothetical protein ACK5Y2_11665 [Bdellovibrionales bacterium]
MIRLGLLLLSLLTASACSLYKSESRDNFEDNAKATLPLQTTAHPDPKPTLESSRQMQCDEVSEIQYWYETRFPAPHTEWVESGSDHLEVWRTDFEHGGLQIRSYEHAVSTITRCEISFSSEREWQRLRKFYFKSLEGDQL